MSTINQPIERMTEEELQKIEASLKPASYERYCAFGQPDVLRLTYSLRNAYAEIDVLRSDRNNLLAVIEREIAPPENQL